MKCCFLESVSFHIQHIVVGVRFALCAQETSQKPFDSKRVVLCQFDLQLDVGPPLGVTTVVLWSTTGFDHRSALKPFKRIWLCRTQAGGDQQLLEKLQDYTESVVRHQICYCFVKHSQYNRDRLLLHSDFLYCQVCSRQRDTVVSVEVGETILSQARERPKQVLHFPKVFVVGRDPEACDQLDVFLQAVCNREQT